MCYIIIIIVITTKVLCKETGFSYNGLYIDSVFTRMIKANMTMCHRKEKKLHTGSVRMAMKLYLRVHECEQCICLTLLKVWGNGGTGIM